MAQEVVKRFLDFVYAIFWKLYLLFLVLYAFAILYNGLIFEYLSRFLIPDKPTRTRTWKSFFGSKGDLDCKTLVDFHFKPSCIKVFMMHDNSHILKAISSMSSSSKWWYLMTMRSLKEVAPYSYIAANILIVAIIFGVLAVLSQLILDLFGYNKKVEYLKPSYLISALWNYKVMLRLSGGIFFISTVVCYFSSIPKDETCCQNSVCLYCGYNLLRTFFKDLEEVDAAVAPEKWLSFLSTISKYLVSAVMTIGIYCLTTSLVAICGFVLMKALGDACDAVPTISFKSMKQGINSMHQTITEWRDGKAFD